MPERHWGSDGHRDTRGSHPRQVRVRSRGRGSEAVAAGQKLWPRVRTWLAAWAAVAVGPRGHGQVSLWAGRAGALEAGHLRLPALALSARPFVPLLSVLHETTPKANINSRPRHKFSAFATRGNPRVNWTATSEPGVK